ncbi:MAG: hypothetical protein GWP03_01800 [Proteobacteria bacterium]|nr:hypothetical protein [Pseudomonadota bacterium]
MIILEGKPVKEKIISEVKDYIDEGKDKVGILLATDNRSAAVYAKSQVKMFTKYGIEADLCNPDGNAKQEEILAKIEKWNNDENLYGIMLLSPMYRQLNRNKIVESLRPDKDIEGIKAINLGKLMLNEKGLFPPTAVASVEILKHYGIETEGKNCVIVGRSVIVGKSLAVLLLRYGKMGNATITVCHSKTVDIVNYVKRADIIFSAIGRAGYFKASDFKRGAIYVDIGINVVEENGKRVIVGDVEPDEVEHLYAYTPVPGGVGTVTNAILLRNYVESKRRKDING